MSCYWFNRQELLRKVKDRYHNGGDKEEPAAYHIANKDVIKEKKQEISIETCQKKKKKQIENIVEMSTKKT